jgi:hypothetical protein
LAIDQIFFSANREPHLGIPATLQGLCVQRKFFVSRIATFDCSDSITSIRSKSCAARAHETDAVVSAGAQRKHRILKTLRCFEDSHGRETSFARRHRRARRRRRRACGRRAYLLGGWQYTSNDAPTLSLPGTAVPTAGGAATAGATPNGANNVYFARAFVQFAGFTAGKAVSVFDFFDTARYSLQTNFAYQDLGRFGINTFNYTAQLGNGWSAGLGIEDGTFYARPIKDLNAAPPAGVIAGFGTIFPILAAGGPTNSPWNNAGLLVPDIAGNVRVDQPWGAAQIMGALHDDRARYYNATANGVISGVAHPADAWGWAAGAGLRVNLPSPGDSFDVQAQYCRGWSGRCIINSSSRLADQTFGLVNGGTIGLAWVDDAFMANSAVTGATQLQLPVAWNIYAGIQHYWVPNLRTSLYGGYVNYRAESSAVDALVCAPNRFGPGCADWAAWQIGSRTLWNPVRSLDVGVDVQYTALSKTAFDGGTVTFAPTGAAPTTFRVGTTGVVSALLRIQHNFYP